MSHHDERPVVFLFVWLLFLHVVGAAVLVSASPTASTVMTCASRVTTAGSLSSGSRRSSRITASTAATIDAPPLTGTRRPSTVEQPVVAAVGPVSPSTDGSTDAPVPSPPPLFSGPRRTKSASRSVSASLAVSTPPALPPPTRIVFVEPDRALSGLTLMAIGALIGGVVLVVALVFGAVVLRPRLLAAWRKRRRTGDGPDQLESALQDRTNQYRWYEDAEAVAQDLERRGDNETRVDHVEALKRELDERLLDVPDASPATDDNGANAIPPHVASVNPSVIAMPSGVVAGSGNPLRDFTGANSGGTGEASRANASSHPRPVAGVAYFEFDDIDL